MNETIIASATLRKPLPPDEPKDKRRIVASLKLYQLGGNQRPYFSATGDIINDRYSSDRKYESGGCIHDDLLKHFPQVAPIVALHLADDNGVPMHAVANAAYWLGFTNYKTATFHHPKNGYGEHPLPYFPHFENLWRITPTEGRTAYDWCRNSYTKDAFGTPEQALEVLAVAMLPRWKAEADAALALIQSLA